MKKFLLMLLMVVGVSACADDSYLYWMLSDDVADGWTTLKISYGAGNYLTIIDDIGEPYFTAAEMSGEEYAGYAEVRSGAGEINAFFASLAGQGTTDTFVLELYYGLDKTTYSLDYSAASDFIAGYNEITAPGFSATPYGFGPAAVPEPTSGMLVLIGGALLALRRKRRPIV